MSTKQIDTVEEKKTRPSSSAILWKDQEIGLFWSDFLRLKNGEIVEKRSMLDQLSLMQQLVLCRLPVNKHARKNFGVGIISTPFFHFLFQKIRVDNQVISQRMKATASRRNKMKNHKRGLWSSVRLSSGFQMRICHAWNIESVVEPIFRVDL